MSEHREFPSSGEFVTGLAAVSTGLGVLTMALFPLTLGGLLVFVAVPLVVVVAPFVLLPLLVLLLAAPFILVFRGVRRLSASRRARAQSRRPHATGGRLVRREPARHCS